MRNGTIKHDFPVIFSTDWKLFVFLSEERNFISSPLFSQHYTTAHSIIIKRSNQFQAQYCLFQVPGNFSDKGPLTIKKKKLHVNSEDTALSWGCVACPMGQMFSDFPHACDIHFQHHQLTAAPSAAPRRVQSLALRLTPGSWRCRLGFPTPNMSAARHQDLQVIHQLTEVWEARPQEIKKLNKQISRRPVKITFSLDSSISTFILSLDLAVRSTDKLTSSNNSVWSLFCVFCIKVSSLSDKPAPLTLTKKK